MKTRTEELRALMDAHNLTPSKVGKILNRKPMTVRIWMCKSDGRNIPEHALELLRIKAATQQ